MKKKKTQLLGIVLSAAMLATSVPAPVYAEPTDNVAEEENNGAVVLRNQQKMQKILMQQIK